MEKKSINAEFMEAIGVPESGYRDVISEMIYNGE